VPLKVYDETIRVLKSAIQNAKLGHEEELQALKRLDAQARLLERTATGPSLEAFMAGERDQRCRCVVPANPRTFLECLDIDR
jgi:hypothetical protein